MSARDDVDVQMFPGGTILAFTTAVFRGAVHLMPHEFDALVEKVAEAAVNKKGRTSLDVPASEVQKGDWLMGKEVHSISELWRNGLSTTGIAFSDWGCRAVPSEETIKIERPIQ